MTNLKRQKGFTLIELLIAISIFMGFMVVATSAYLEVIRAQKSANETRQIYSELRNFVDYVNNEMREGTVDYFCYNQDLLQNLDFTQMALVKCYDASTLTVESGDNLRTVSRDGLTSSIIKFDAASRKVCLQRYRNVNGSWQLESGYENSAVTGSTEGAANGCGAYKEFAFSNLKVNDLRFEILPKKDPFQADSAKNLATQLQPMVRMYLDVGSKLDTVKFDLKYQTLITARN
jgi:prepilin-type N-terminal cleavage/methylation domain-containing protein